MLMKINQLQSSFSTLLQDAALYTNKGDLNSATETYNKFLLLCNEVLETVLLHNKNYYENPMDVIPIVRTMVNGMFMQADVLQSMGDLKQAEQLRKQTLSIANKYLSKSKLADIERARAESLIMQGRFNEALMAFETGRDIFQDDSNTINWAITTINIVEIYRWLGDYERALSELKHVEEKILPKFNNISSSFSDTEKKILSAEEENDQIQLRSYLKEFENISALSQLSKKLKFFKGLVNEYLGNIEDAEISFLTLLAEYEKQTVQAEKMGENGIVESNAVAMHGIKSHLAAIMIKKGRYQEALSYAYNLESYFRKNSTLRPKLAAILKIQSDALLKLGSPELALDKLEAGIKDLEHYYDPDLLWKLQWNKGLAFSVLDQKKKALEAYSQAINTANNLRKAPLGYRLDSTYMKDKLDLFEMAIGLACTSQSAKQCCEFMELIKSRILNATLSVPRRSQSESMGELEGQFDRLTLQLDINEYACYKEGWPAELTEKRRSILDERAHILERIQISDPRWRSITEPIPFDFDNVARVLLSRGQAALNLFYKSDKIVVAVLIKDGQSSAAQIVISPNIISKLEDYQRNLRSRRNLEWYDLLEKLCVHAEDLLPSELLFQALSAKSLIIVPHGLLHLIPWAGLTFNGRRLFEYCPVGILPNLSCIINLNATFSSRPRVALIGAPEYKDPFTPLYGSEMEIEDILQIYSNTDMIEKPIIGKEATKENFWKLAKYQDASGGILHIACHGTFDYYEPMNSGLLLAESDINTAEISKVDAARIAQSSIKYDEVVLSACSTGTRPIKAQNIKLIADDIVGLPGAFLEAGAKSVLVSIPLVDDFAALRFMKVYHQNRKQGKTPLLALQETQKRMLTNSKHPPYNWLGFTVYGCQ